MKSCLHFFIFSCCLNSKTFKCRKILHFQKHSSLHNCFWKRTMFFIFSFFYFLCNLKIQTGPLSVTKYKIFCNLQYIFFINFTNIWFYFMIECKFCIKMINRSWASEINSIRHNPSRMRLAIVKKFFWGSIAFESCFFPLRIL